MRHFLIAVLLLGCACKRATDGNVELTPTKESIGEVAMIDYLSPRGDFTCLAPANWKLTEFNFNGGDESHFTGENASISIGKNVNAAQKTAEEFANRIRSTDPLHKPTVTKSNINGHDIYTFDEVSPVRKLHSKKVLYEAKERSVVIQCGKDYYEISLSAKPEAFDAALPVFESVVKSFKPQS